MLKDMKDDEKTGRVDIVRLAFPMLNLETIWLFLLELFPLELVSYNYIPMLSDILGWWPYWFNVTDQQLWLFITTGVGTDFLSGAPEFRPGF